MILKNLDMDNWDMNLTGPFFNEQFSNWVKIPPPPPPLKVGKQNCSHVYLSITLK